MKLHLASLGCARNQVDSEVMLGCLTGAGYTLTDTPAEAEVIIVNTCSFITSAIDESIDTILELAKYKTNGVCRRLIVAGCLPERFREEIVPALPEVDAFIGTGAFLSVVQAVEGAPSLPLFHLPDPNSAPLQVKDTPRALSSSLTAYLKISDGCSRHCSYCIIPTLRGTQKSRSVEDIVAEARGLIEKGINELVLVAQDTTFYGKDLAVPRPTLGILLDALADISTDVWIRVLYGHPESIEEDTILAVGNHPNICSYFDIPVQHASGKILKKMGRSYDQEDLFGLFERIRTHIPDVVLRTSIIVGFPGETEADFEMLLDFVRAIRFDHLGVFTYSDAEDLPSHQLPHPVSPEVAMARYDEIMSCQLEISREKLRMYTGKQLTVLVEESPEEDLYIGRTAYQAPEVDGITYIRSGDRLKNGFASVTITDSLEYDLIGETA
ncbi:MAG: 30S ribosomal protein S12 methylthiotransferase RimO [Desulfobacterales bacterium]